MILGMALASSSLQAALSRGFTTTQSLSSPLVLNQPLPSQLPTAVPAQVAPAKKQVKEKNVAVVPPAPAPKKITTAVDTRKLDVTTKAYENKKVFVAAKSSDKKTAVAIPASKPKIAPTKFDPPTRDRHSNNRMTGINVFVPMPKSKPRHHGFGDWP
jgi:hypothetical protein